jgi:hypothetical protein
MDPRKPNNELVSMADDWDLEDWLLDAGEAAEMKHAGGGQLSSVENLIRELWVFDIESVNGGVSQYFCNHAERWSALVAAASAFEIEPLRSFMARVEEVVKGSIDPYSALVESSGLDELYVECRLDAWRQVQALAGAA